MSTSGQGVDHFGTVQCTVPKWTCTEVGQNGSTTSVHIISCTEMDMYRTGPGVGPVWYMGLGPVRYMTTSGKGGGRLRYSPISVHELYAESACSTSVQEGGPFRYSFWTISGDDEK